MEWFCGGGRSVYFRGGHQRFVASRSDPALTLGRSRHPTQSMATPTTHLATLGLDAGDLAGLEPAAQFAFVRKGFLAAALQHHPDKGGDPTIFRLTHAAFTALKAWSRSGTVSLLDAAAVPPGGYGGDEAAAGPKFSSQYYDACPGDAPPAYNVSVAPTARAKCTKCKAEIAKGELRFGSMNEATGSYGWWHHLGCVRVPSIVHSYLPSDLTDVAGVAAALLAMDGLSVEGVAALSPEHLAQLVAAVTSRDKWAKTTAKKRAAIDADKKVGKKPKVGAPTTTTTSTTSTTSTALAPKPLPATAAAPPEIKAGALVGKTVVLTGVFDVSGGVGMARGKGGVEAWIKGAGGKVTGAISKKTDFLVVGTLPGASKVSKAQALGVPLLTVAGLKALLGGEGDAANVERADVSNVAFSKGFGGNAVGHRLAGPVVGQPVVAALAAPPSAPDGTIVA